MKLLIVFSLCLPLLFALSNSAESISYEITRLNVVPTLQLGEGPHWDIPSQSLYFVDSVGRTINCYKYQDDMVYTARIDNKNLDDDIGFIIPVKNKRNEFIIGQGARVLRIRWDSVSPTYCVTEVLVHVENVEENRMNDAKADRNGRLFFGTMNRELENRTAYFYSKEKNKALKQIFSSVAISNGISWNCRNNKMFCVDTRNENIQVMDYNPRTGNVGNPSVYIDFDAEDYLPDGMTIDVNDYIYIAIFNANGILRVNPKTRKVDFKIEINEITNVTSSCFGGPQLNELFVTSSNFLVDPNDERFSRAGGIYKVKFSDPSIRGFPMNNVDL